MEASSSSVNVRMTLAGEPESVVAEKLYFL